MHPVAQASGFELQAMESCDSDNMLWDGENEGRSDVSEQAIGF
jgi:hypothetical protein